MPKPLAQRLRSLSLALSLATAAGGMGGLAFWDEQREAAASLSDFADEQATLAQGLAVELERSLDSARRDALVIAALEDQRATLPAALVGRYPRMRIVPPGDPSALAPGDGATVQAPTASGGRVVLPLDPASLLAGLERLERPGERLFALRPPGARALMGVGGRALSSAPLEAALLGSSPTLRLSRAEAAELGLQARTALAGIARLPGPGGGAQLAVVTTAHRVRDRQQRARARLVLSILSAAGLVFVFGGVALRRQRRELELSKKLELADLEKQRDADLLREGRAAMMGTLGVGMAHEIATPLSVIAGRAEQLLPRVAGDERSARAVRVILEQTERVGQVIRGLLHLSRGGSPAVAEISPGSVVEGAVQLVEHRFNRARVALDIARGEPLPMLRGDRLLLEHALVNLLLNACEACVEGGKVSVRVAAEAGQVLFAVEDDGVGITPEEASRAAEAFFTTKPMGQGTGLGLAITSEIVKAHHGSFAIAPRTPRGTRACLRIPAA